MYAVRTLSRAVQIYPGLSDRQTQAFCCSVNADESTGSFDRTAFKHQWNAYRIANEKILEKAVPPVKPAATKQVNAQPRLSNKKSTIYQALSDSV